MESGLGQLGINLQSMLLYFVNFGALFLLLRYFLGKKVLALLDERRERISQSLEAADALKREVAEEKAKLDKEMQALRAKLVEEQTQLRQSLEAERAQALAEVEKHRSQALAQVQTEAENMRTALYADMQSELRTVVREMLFRILGEKVPDGRIDAAVEEARKTV